MASTALVHGSHGGIAVPKAHGKLVKGFLSLKRHNATLKAKGQEAMESVVGTAVTLSGAFVLSAIQGVYWDNKDKDGKPTYGLKVAGVSLDLGVGILAHIAGFMGLGGKYSDQMKNFGNGALASYMSNVGRGVGYKWAQEKKKTGGTAGSLEDQISNLME